MGKTKFILAKIVSVMIVACLLGSSQGMSASAQTTGGEVTVEQVVAVSSGDVGEQLNLLTENIDLLSEGTGIAEGDYRYTVNEEGNAVITAYYGTETELVVPSTLGGYAVVKISGRAFAYCIGLTSIVIPEGVTEIDWGVFDGCEGLTNITLPETLTKIGDSAFKDCANLVNVVIPNGVTEIGKYAFSNCSSLTSVTLPEKITLIDEATFFRCESLTNIRIPDNVTEIGKNAFDLCKGLTSITLSENIVKIDYFAFADCKGLTNIVLPEGLTVIGISAFENSGLTSIIIPKNVTEICISAFKRCTNLKSVTIQGNATKIGEQVFWDCSGLENISITGCVTEIGTNAFRECSSLVSIDIPEGVTKIGRFAFNHCTGLTSIVIPEGVTEICDFTFQECSNLTSVTIPKSVTKISGKLFGGADFSLAYFPKVTIYGYGGSYAETFAKKVNSTFVDIGVHATKVTLNKASISINKGKTYTLKVTVKPAHSTDVVTWTSSNPKVAKVSEKGVVTAVKKGTATITVKTTNGKTATCKVTVKDIPATKIKLNKTTVTINKGKTVTLKATLIPENSTDTITWSTSKKSIATVSDKGVVTGVKNGTATITAKTSSGKKATCKVTVKEIKSTKVKLNKTKVTLKVGKSVTLKATLTPKNSTDTVKWSSSKKSVAKVSDKGKVTAVKKGTATITAKTSSGKKVTCKVTVK